ncbi:transglutaminase-like domain-containing protein [Fischerella thermalis]|jgi:transglutaminase-like putative cysteine protease|uniref:Transglutaminase domain-containing protein n=3 Tax=Fischerella TaxID=1190 RepID=G6FUE6_9CYAN|nr:transglutaminase family protein [Fischerella thermalis]PMB05274.1 transglutaminase [Fischerella thermalis CCMEE 5273]EHC12876.1 transglutaminase domain-containing protein [Fischerella thermalis JSC-11]PLZ07670.1 transglutaminase [Fischerella thermalis WC1110]PLZ09794.1 transglutaminase [Fischerella thermalis WC114]PLZ10829.1 transglutaminase [Fischerella thermalis WC119]
MNFALPSLTASQMFGQKTIRPIGAAILSGIAFFQDTLIAIDSPKGYLLQIDPATDNTKILNPHQSKEFTDVTGLAIWEDTLWVTRGNSVYLCKWNSWGLEHFVTLPYPANGIAVWESTVYVSCQKLGDIVIFNRDTRKEITRFYAPGVGVENLAVTDEILWACDATEQSVYCMDRATGEVQFSVLTPFESPTGIAVQTEKNTGQQTLYVAYASEEPYVRDNPNADPNHELAYRDRTFIHPLYYRYFPEKRYALSNGYLIEMSYVEEIAPIEEVYLQDLEWRIALPSDTDRQKVKHVEPVGLPFTEEIIDGQRVAVFKFDALTPGERHMFGWKAVLEVRGIKYRLTPTDVEDIPELSPEYQTRYLVDNDELAMDTTIVRRAAQEAIGTETNLLRKMYSIRNYVYDQLSYGIKPYIDTPDRVLERGVGSCGEYVGVLLALCRLNGIACRTVGRYKCPTYAEHQHVPLQPDYNHVWLEFYIPGFGWLPMESNPDDIGNNGPYPTRFFMGLCWYHIEIGKGIPFETITSKGVRLTKEEISIGELAINHIRFTILGELPPF